MADESNKLLQKEEMHKLPTDESYTMKL